MANRTRKDDEKRKPSMELTQLTSWPYYTLSNIHILINFANADDTAVAMEIDMGEMGACDNWVKWLCENILLPSTMASLTTQRIWFLHGQSKVNLTLVKLEVDLLKQS